MRARHHRRLRYRRGSERWAGPAARSSVARRHAAGLLAALLVVGCAMPPGGAPGVAGDPRSDLPLPPPGYGTLRQEDVSISMRLGDLRVLVTPLMDPVLLATAPDTYRRLDGLATTQGLAAARAAGGPAPVLFLVSFFSNVQGTTFQPEALNLVSRGLRLRPDAIVPVTPGWGQRRVAQLDTEMAVYAFLGEVDLESELYVLYAGQESAEWSAIRPRIQAELERARARAGSSGGPRRAAAGVAHSSRSYLEIFR